MNKYLQRKLSSSIFFTKSNISRIPFITSINRIPIKQCENNPSPNFKNTIKN